MTNLLLLKKPSFLLVGLLILGGVFVLNQPGEIWQLVQPQATAPQVSLNLPRHPPLSLIFVGDIMLSRAVGEKMLREKDFRWPFLKIGGFLQKADLVFGNLEGPISEKGQKVGSIYSFRADPRTIEGLKYAGFDILSVANNHIGDWTREAMEDTFNNLSQAGISYVGGGFTETEAYGPVIKEIKGVSLAFLAYTALGPAWTEAKGETSGIAFAHLDRLKAGVQKAKTEADLVIVSFHFGQEYQKTPNQKQRKLAQAAIEAGASLVIGHHPHIIQPIQKYRQDFIAYSLGNFVFDQSFSQETMTGLLLEVTIKNKKIAGLNPLKIKISSEFQPQITSFTESLKY